MNRTHHFLIAMPGMEDERFSRSVIYLWPALIMVALIVTSAAESSMLVDFGWLTLIICAVKASQDHSWRVRLARAG